MRTGRQQIPETITGANIYWKLLKPDNQRLIIFLSILPSFILFSHLYHAKELKFLPTLNGRTFSYLFPSFQDVPYLK